jgi:crotonobetainyl-CoA:carnitine CoA-transferase CaiB-like acyl-CoA transferase
MVGQALGALGAEVIHVESTMHPDGLRCNTTRGLDEPEWWEWSPLFHGANANKLAIAVDLDSPSGREIFRRLLANSDVLVDNYSPRVLEHWDLGHLQLRREFPDLVVVRAPAYGVTGPWRDRLAYAPTMESQTGLAWLTGFPDCPPEPPSGLSDAIAGAHTTVAVLLALELRRRTGHGHFVECPMVGASLNLAAEQVIEHSAYHNLIMRRGNRSRSCVPQGVFRAAEGGGADERWVAISVSDDAQWRALCRHAGSSLPADVEDTWTLADRRDAEDRIEAGLAAWCRGRTAEAIVARLSAAGVPAEVVVLAHEHASLPPVMSRHTFEAIEHPVTGAARHIGLPFRMANGPHRHVRRPAPRLGEHNRDVLTRIAGLTDAEVDGLERDGVIGRAAFPHS